MKLSVSFMAVIVAAVLAACGDPSDTTPPAAPAGLKAEAGDSKIVLSWQANSEPDLKGYAVNWRESLTSQPGSSESASATATVTGLVNGKTYVFTVSAIDKVGNKSAASAQVISSPKAAAVVVVDQPPVKPRGLIATPQDAQVALNWTPNAEPDLKGYVVFYGTDATALDKTMNLESTQTSTVITGLNNATAYFFALEAQSSKGLKSVRSDTATATPKAVPLSPTLTDVTITDYGPSDQVRQGVGVIEITVKGTHLETLTAAKLGSDPLTIKSKQADGAVLEVNIAHGATLGALTLTVTNPVGTFTRNGALEVVKITAAANPNLNPSDTTGKGTPNRPFRTVTKSLSVAQKGDTVLLTAGVYGREETWPQASTLTPPPTANVADGVTLEGQSETDRAAVVIAGPGADQNFSGLVLGGSAKIQNLTLRNFKYGVLYAIGDPNNPTAQIEVRKIASNSSFDGIHLRNAKTANIFNSEFYRNTASGIYAVGPTKLTAPASISDSNQYGIVAEAGVQLELSVTRCDSNSKDGIYLSLSSLIGERLEVQQNGGNGLQSFSQNGAQTINIRNSSFSSNVNYGVWIQGHPGNIALGTFSGNFADMLLNNNGAEQVYDDRDSSSYFFIKAQIGGADTPTGSFGKGATPAGVTIVKPGNVILFNTPL